MLIYILVLYFYFEENRNALYKYKIKQKLNIQDNKVTYSLLSEINHAIHYLIRNAYAPAIGSIIPIKSLQDHLLLILFKTLSGPMYSAVILKSIQNGILTSYLNDHQGFQNSERANYYFMMIKVSVTKITDYLRVR